MSFHRETFNDVISPLQLVTLGVPKLITLTISSVNMSDATKKEILAVSNKVLYSVPSMVLILDFRPAL